MADEHSSPPDRDDGIVFDQTLFDELARMTPEERLRHNDRMVATLRELRDAFAATGKPDDAARPAGGERD
ncbi:MAG: hypothetical protein QM704_04460 [Anaeromyxobacteraceae bacterium]